MAVTKKHGGVYIEEGLTLPLTPETILGKTASQETGGARLSVVGDLKLQISPSAVGSSAYRMSDGKFRMFSAPVTVDLATSGLLGMDTGSAAKGNFYYVYMVTRSAGCSFVASANANAPVGYGSYRKMGSVLVDKDKLELVKFSQSMNEVNLYARRAVDLGKYPKDSDTVDLSDDVPATAVMVKLTAAVRTVEDERATLRLYVPGESESFEFVESSAGETTAEKSFTMPVPGATKQLKYKLEKTSNSDPTFHIQVTGWVDGSLV